MRWVGSVATRGLAKSFARQQCVKFCAQVAVLVATAEGILYEYAVRNLRAPQGPACALEQESFLLRSDS